MHAVDHVLPASVRNLAPIRQSAGTRPLRVVQSANRMENAVQRGNADTAQQVETAFTSFVGQTFFGQLLRAMRSSLGKPAYFHGGQAEEIFQGQLDQVLAEKMTSQSAATFAQPMFARQFPELARSLNHNPSPRPEANRSLKDLDGLRSHRNQALSQNLSSAR